MAACGLALSHAADGPMPGSRSPKNLFVPQGGRDLLRLFLGDPGVRLPSACRSGRSPAVRAQVRDVQEERVQRVLRIEFAFPGRGQSDTQRKGVEVPFGFRNRRGRASRAGGIRAADRPWPAGRVPTPTRLPIISAAATAQPTAFARATAIDRKSASASGRPSKSGRSPRPRSRCLPRGA